MNPFLRSIAALLLLAAGLSQAQAADPEVTAAEEAMAPVSQTRFDTFLALPGRRVDGFRMIHVDACTVEFRKHWLRDQNRDRPLSSRVTERAADHIRERLAASCHETLVEELTRARFGIAADAGDGVLTLRPAIVEFDLFAPEVDAPTQVRSVSPSAGEMTLNLDFIVDGRVVARAVDRQRDRDSTLRQRTRISNEFDTRAMLKRWARHVRESLED